MRKKNKGRKKGRMAGEVFNKAKARGPQPEVGFGVQSKNRKYDQSDSWKNVPSPYSNEAREGQLDKRFKDQKGFDRKLDNNGFRQDFVKDMYADKQIDYYGDNKRYDRMIKKTSRKTGLNFNKVENPHDAEIVNFTTGDKGFITGGRGTNPDNPNSEWGVELQGFGKKYKGQTVRTNGGEYPAENFGGLSTAIDARPYGFDDMKQVNRTDRTLPKKIKRGTMWHELGHSLGLEGDFSITNKNDPSVMSYNQGKNSRLKNREFNSIKDNFKDYM